jgi:hypothetical protein
MVGFNFRNYGTRLHNLFADSPSQLLPPTIGSASFFPKVLTLANGIANKVDFFFMSRQVFKQNVNKII